MSASRINVLERLRDKVSLFLYKNKKKNKQSEQQQQSLQSHSKMPPAGKFEPKKSFRWTFEIDFLDAFLMHDMTLPAILRHSDGGKLEYSDITATLYDPIAPSTSQQIFEWLSENDVTKIKRNAIVKLLDRDGRAIEKWSFVVSLISADFGKLDYSSNEASTVKIVLKVHEAKLT